MKKRKQTPHPLAAFLQQQPRSKQRKQSSPFPFVDISQNKNKRKPLLEQIQHSGSLFGQAPSRATRRKKIKHPRMPPLGDHDGDGAINLLDCQPLNPFKQDRKFHVVAKLTDRWGNPVDPKSAQGKKIMAEISKAEGVPSHIQKLKHSGEYDYRMAKKEHAEWWKKRFGVSPEDKKYSTVYSDAIQKIDKKGLTNPREIQETISEVFAKNNITLSDFEKNMLTQRTMLRTPPIYFGGKLDTRTKKIKKVGKKDIEKNVGLAEFLMSKDPKDRQFIKAFIDRQGSGLTKKEMLQATEEQRKKAYNFDKKRSLAEMNYPQLVPNWHIIYKRKDSKKRHADVFYEKDIDDYILRDYKNPKQAEKEAYDFLERRRDLDAAWIKKSRGVGFSAALTKATALDPSIKKLQMDEKKKRKWIKNTIGQLTKPYLQTVVRLDKDEKGKIKRTAGSAIADVDFGYELPEPEYMLSPRNEEILTKVKKKKDQDAKDKKRIEKVKKRKEEEMTFGFAGTGLSNQKYGKKRVKGTYWPGDTEKHSEAAKKGWEKRRGNVPRSYDVSSPEDLEKKTKEDFKKHAPIWKKRAASIGERNGWDIRYRSSTFPDNIDMFKGDKALYLFKDKNRNKWVVAYRTGDLSTTSMKTYDTVEEAINNLEMLIMII